MHDEIIPTGKWTFDKSVTDVFDDMLKRSIPDYSTMRSLCFEIGKRFIKRDEKNVVLDIGASRGEALAPFVEYVQSYEKYYPPFVEYVDRKSEFHAVEVSEPMRMSMLERFSDIDSVFVSGKDIAKDFPNIIANLILSVFTIQFIPINYRQQILRNIYKSMTEDGAFIFVEKVLGSNADIDDLFTSLYHTHKKTEGHYTAEQIERKALSLEGVLVPVTSSWNESLLRNAGFSSVDCFWRCMNFEGWIAVK